MRRIRTLKVAMIAAAATSALAICASPASADVIQPNSTNTAYGCHGYLVKDAPNYYYAVEITGNCYVSIDWTSGSRWEKAAGWELHNTASEGSVYTSGSDKMEVCLTPKSDSQFSYETCGPLVNGG